MKKQQNVLQEMLFDIPWKADFAIAIALYIILHVVALIFSPYATIKFPIQPIQMVCGMLCSFIYGGAHVMKYLLPVLFIFLGIRGFLKKQK